MPFIAKAAHLPEKDIDDRLPIYNSGIVSSLRLLEMMTFIEKAFGIVIRPEELIEDNFRDVGTIAGFIQSKTRRVVAGET
ncbi:MAG: acyl carrier protein [Spirochaetales bacterium]|nr:acyl carrier protein [Spirochaetales bacterium]